VRKGLHAPAEVSEVSEHRITRFYSIEGHDKASRVLIAAGRKQGSASSQFF